MILITTKKGSEGRAKLTYSNTTQFHTAWMTPKFQNIYGNNEGEFTSWGKRLDTPTSYDPMDFFQTGATEINALTLYCRYREEPDLCIGRRDQRSGIMPESDYNRYNFSIRNTSKFYNDKLTLDLGANYIIQNNKNFVGSGEYFNPSPRSTSSHAARTSTTCACSSASTPRATS